MDSSAWRVGTLSSMLVFPTPPPRTGAVYQHARSVFPFSARYFVIITRLNIDWPPSIEGFTSILSALTGAVQQVRAH